MCLRIKQLHAECVFIFCVVFSKEVYMYLDLEFITQWHICSRNIGMLKLYFYTVIITVMFR
jgi:hypothetical protein